MPGLLASFLPTQGVLPPLLAAEVAWTPVSGKGTVYSTVTMHRAYTQAYEGEIPYNLSLVDLDEGVRVWTNVIGIPPAEVKCGLRVEVVYEDVTPEITLAKFRPPARLNGNGEPQRGKKEGNQMIEVPTYKTVLVENADGITTVTLNRPEKRNAMSPQLHYGHVATRSTRLEADDADARAGAHRRRRGLVRRPGPEGVFPRAGRQSDGRAAARGAHAPEWRWTACCMFPSRRSRWSTATASAAASRSSSPATSPSPPRRPCSAFAR